MHEHAQLSKKPVLGTGLSGLVGSKFVELFQSVYDFKNLDLASGVDITDEMSVKKVIEENPAEVLIHFAAFTDVSKAHEQQGDKSGAVYKVNVEGTRYIAQASKNAGKHLIHISTAYVFDGEKGGLYTEEDQISPIEWYGQTKAWAEEEVAKSGVNSTILRIDQPYRQDEFPKKDILHRIKEQLETNTLPPMFTDHTFTATRIEEFAQTLNFIIQKRPQGIFHASTDEKTSDYEFALKVKEQFGLPGEVKQGSLVEYLKTAKRPYQKNTAMDTQKLQETKIKLGEKI